MRPFLKWLGNKHKLLPIIQEHLNSSHCLIEPFAGSCAIFLGTGFNKYILSDQNKDLISLYKILSKEGEPFIHYCKKLFTKENNSSESYYQFREQFNITPNKRLKAALFLYLNRHGYNGLCRYNSTGGYNVPFGTFQLPYFPEKEMLHFHERSKNVDFYSNDFEKTMHMASPGDLIYCDPPYVPLTASASFTSYTKQSFNETHQIRLVGAAEKLANEGTSIIISNHDTEITRDYYKNAKQIISFPVSRVISCKGSKRTPVKELLAIY